MYIVFGMNSDVLVFCVFFFKDENHQVHIKASSSSGSREKGKDLDSRDYVRQYVQTLCMDLLGFQSNVV